MVADCVCGRWRSEERERKGKGRSSPCSGGSASTVVQTSATARYIFLSSEWVLPNTGDIYII